MSSGPKIVKLLLISIVIKLFFKKTEIDKGWLENVFILKDKMAVTFIAKFETTFKIDDD